MANGSVPAHVAHVAHVAHALHPAIASASFSGGAAAALVFVYLAIAVISIIAAVKVVTKAGYSGWWVLVAFVPIVGLVMALVFAFADWPVLRELRALRAQVTSSSGYRSPHDAGGGAAPGGGSAGTGLPPAGWYPAPDGRQRYWDGHAWTDHFA